MHVSNEPSPWGRSLRGSYPDPNLWSAYTPEWKPDVFRYVALWLTEGIPYAFSETPIVFEYAREHLATRLHEKARNIGITGSARSGYSLAPEKYGMPYQVGKSDLDLFLVSATWFDQLVSDFELFLGRYRSQLAAPRNDREKIFFDCNAREAPGTIARGFIDQWRVPAVSRYQYACELGGAGDGFRQCINREVDPANQIGRLSFRVYRDWDAVIRQIGGSVLRALTERAKLLASA